MTGHRLEIELRGPIAPFGKRENIEQLLDQTMEHLLTCDVIDPSVAESYLSDDDVSMEFSMYVEADKPEDAVLIAMSALRASLHVAGAGTPGWEELVREMRSEVRATSDDDGLVDA